MAEQWTLNPQVGGSNPPGRTRRIGPLPRSGPMFVFAASGLYYGPPLQGSIVQGAVGRGHVVKGERLHVHP